MKEYALFVGCMISSRFPQFEAATIKAFKKFKINLRQMKDWTCCPEPISMQILSLKSWYAIAARNICLAENEGLDILTLCNGCNMTLFRANKDLRSDDRLRAEINEYLKTFGKEFKGKITVKSMLSVLYKDVGLKKIHELVQNPLYGIKAAVHYGCHIFDELKEYDNANDPTSLKNLVKALGANVCTYQSEMLCCGGYARNINEEVSLEIVEEKLNDLSRIKTDCLILAGCPYCFLQFDLNQIILEHNLKKRYRIPILYYTQLLGLAMGFSAEDMGLQYHRVKVDRLLKKLESREAIDFNV